MGKISLDVFLAYCGIGAFALLIMFILWVIVNLVLVTLTCGSKRRRQQAKALKRLRGRLGGECGTKCPSYETAPDVWNCLDCFYYFGFLGGTNKQACPCSLVQHYGVSSEELFFRLDEVIEELGG